jgi:glutaminyl-tRNA synthetase
MAAKELSEAQAALAQRFAAAGMDAKPAEDAARSAKGGPALAAAMDACAAAISGSVGGDAALKPFVGALVKLANEIPHAGARLYCARRLGSGDLPVANAHVAAAVAFLKKNAGKAQPAAGEEGAWTPADESAFDKAAGVGRTEMTAEATGAAVATWFADAANAEFVTSGGGWKALGRVLGKLRAVDDLRFADPRLIKESVDVELEKLCGPKQTLDAAGKKALKAQYQREAKEKKRAAAAAATKEEIEPPSVRFPKPEENTQNRPEILAAHLKRTGGKVRCRFPPEPNGYLHIGHAKSMNLNFSYPMAEGGSTRLRFDDTNPEAEKQEYIDSIKEDMAWLGWEPQETRYSSDDFDQLHKWAIQLIEDGKAYVCHQTGDEIKRGRELRENSPWRDTSVEENLRKFEDMRLGKYEEGKATLRLKMDMQSDVSTMRDLIAYRVKYVEHPHAGDKWCIYPSYDYTHCLVDSIEDITHSLCTLEFVIRRDSYYWLLDALDLYKPLVWEYSRLNITHTVLSKRRLIKLVTSGTVRGWDDPRMPSISGYRRRGFTPESINDFCGRIGVTRHAQEIEASLLDQCCREDLNKKAYRRMCVLRPVRVTVRNWSAAVESAAASSTEGNFTNVWRSLDEAERARGCAKLTIANLPTNTDAGSHEVDVSANLFIDADDFREADEKGYKRLAPGVTVGLAHLGASLRAVSFEKEGGAVTEIVCDVDFLPKEKPRGYIHWVCAPPGAATPHAVEIRLYSPLFRSKTPAALSAENFLADVNPNSLVVVDGAFVDSSADAAKPGEHAQFERTGYFVCDKDSTSDKQVWNRVVPLKEEKWENSA